MTTIDRMAEESYTLEVEEGGDSITAYTLDGRETELPVEDAEAALLETEGLEPGDGVEVGDFTAIVSEYPGLDLDFHIIGEDHPGPLVPVTHCVSVEREQLERAVDIARGDE